MELRSFPFSTRSIAPEGEWDEESVLLGARNICKWHYALHVSGARPTVPVNTLFLGSAWDAVKLLALWAERLVPGSWYRFLQIMRSILEPRLVAGCNICRRLPCPPLQESSLFFHQRRLLPSKEGTTFVEGRWYLGTCAGRSGPMVYLKSIVKINTVTMRIVGHFLVRPASGLPAVGFALQRDVEIEALRGVGPVIAVSKTPVLPLFFSRAESFDGLRPGLVYKLGIYGLGYYVDAPDESQNITYYETLTVGKLVFSANGAKAYAGRWLKTP